MRTVYYPQVPEEEEPILLEFIKYGVSPKQYIEVQTEWNMAYDPKMIMAFFEELAKEIIRTDPSITRVVFGGGGNTPEDHKYPLQQKPYSHIRDFKAPYGRPGYDSWFRRFVLDERPTPTISRLRYILYA